MTKEQVEHMRYGVEIGEYRQVNEEVGRLLDEREALLEALKRLVLLLAVLRKSVLVLHVGVTFGDMDAARLQAEAAIAKAEAE